MAICPTPVSPAVRPHVRAGNAEPSHESFCDLWMIDYAGSTVLRCHCLESSPSGMRLRVPLGYGVGVGQRYELRAHLPGERPTAGVRLIGSAWITISHARIPLTEDADHLDVHAIRDPLENALRLSVQPHSAGESPAAL
jgi:hypothetical protein